MGAVVPSESDGHRDSKPDDPFSSWDPFDSTVASSSNISMVAAVATGKPVMLQCIFPMEQQMLSDGWESALNTTSALQIPFPLYYYPGAYAAAEDRKRIGFQVS